MKKYVIIVGGGKGTRMGNNLPKQFLPIAGKPLLMHTLEKFNRWDPKAELVLVLPESYRSYWEMLCREIGCKVRHRLVTGGETRFYSVKNGLESIYAEINASSEKALIGVHDGVRPFVSEQVITECFRIADEKGAAIPTLPVIDSLREIQSDGSSRAIDRSLYYAVHTPQVFRSDILFKAYEQPYKESFTDDASVVESLSIPVEMVPSNRENIKITTPIDYITACGILEQEKGNTFIFPSSTLRSASKAEAPT